MQPQGLEALMQQSQPAPQMGGPRLAAATDLVASDAEKQILDPRTLAMLKYKDAVQAMQAADQMMAAAQPQPMPPTVAERTKLAAEQGIAGLAQRLAPGIQQQGGQMAAQQAQQAMQGGLPQLSAPNMVRMAGGGIVAFAEGGGPLPTAGGREDDYVVTTDELGNPIYASDIARTAAAGTTDTSEEGAALRAAYAALQGERPNLRELARTPERPSTSTARVPTTGYGMGDRTGQSDALVGMASGVVDSIRDGLGSLVPRGLSDEEIAAETTVTRGPSPRETGSMSDEEIAAFLETPRSYGGQLLIDAAQYAKDNPVEAAGLALMTASGVGAVGAGLSAAGRSLLARYGPKVVGALRAFVSKPNPAFMVGPQPLGTAARVFSPGRTGASLYAGDKLLDYLQSSESEPPAEEGVPTGAPTTPVPADTTARATPSGATNMPGGVANAARAQPDLNVGIATPTNTALDQLRARVEEGAGSEGAGKRFRELTGVDDVIEQRRVEQERLRELQESRFSPEQERGRLLRAALASGAQRGLGGFGIGYAAEEERIANERQTLQQQVVADMDKTISELRALGVGQFEAEQAAQQIHSNEIRDLAKLDQDAAIAEMDYNLRLQGMDAEQRSAQIKAINDYALRMQMAPKDVYALASDVLGSALPGTMTFAQALEQVSASLDEMAPSVITNIRPAE
jgi:hypothetical protein